MGNTAIGYTIRAAASAFGKAANDMRASRACADLAEMLASDRPFDRDDRELLALLLMGELNKGRGGRGKSYKGLPEAERETRKVAKAKKVSLATAADEVARRHGVQPDTLTNELRRSKRAKRPKPRPPGKRSN